MHSSRESARTYKEIGRERGDFGPRCRWRSLDGIPALVKGSRIRNGLNECEPAETDPYRLQDGIARTRQFMRARRIRIAVVAVPN